MVELIILVKYICCDTRDNLNITLLRDKYVRMYVHMHSIVFVYSCMYSCMHSTDV